MQTRRRDAACGSLAHMNAQSVARLVALSSILLAACGGRDIPLHSGYKSAKAKPWKKPKNLALNEKFEGKIDGELNYSTYKRARWYAVQLPSAGELALALEITPPADAEDFDLAMEVFDPGNRVIAKADLEEEDAKETTKKRTVEIAAPGRYLIQMYLQGRMDIAEYELQLAFTPKPGEMKTDFPASVQFIDELPQVPLTDDTPADRRPKVIAHTGRRPPSPPKKDPVVVAPTASTSFSGMVLKVIVVGDGTEITFSRSEGVSTGMKGRVVGVQSGGFTVGNCTDRSCKGVVKATPDQIGAGKVIISQ